MMDELSDIISDNDKDEVFKRMVGNMFAVMSDRSSVNKSLNSQLQSYPESLLGEDSIDLHFLFCNAHFLLGLSNTCESVLKMCEKELVKDMGHGLGRDASAKFSRFNSSGESSGARYIRTGCDVLGPRGDQKNGCKAQWDAFCSETLNEPSFITSFRMNRFNNFFQGAAGLYFHRDHISTFLHEYKGPLNMKLESVLLDCNCPQINAIERALGIIYYVVTGPFWNLLQSNVHYLDQYKYIQAMLKKFQDWCQDGSELLKEGVCLFPEFAVKQDVVFGSLYKEQESNSDLTKSVLEKIMGGFVEVTKRQLNDFLEGGIYGSEPDDELRDKLKHCKVTNLVSEYEFGNLDYSQFRRRYASLHHHSSIQMVKTNKTISKWLSSKSCDDQSRLLHTAREKSHALRQKHRDAEREVVRKTEERMKEASRKMKEKEAAKIEAKQTLVAKVRKHGGPCITSDDVNNVISQPVRCNEKLEIIKDEIRYLKTILGVVDKRLVFGKKDLETLVSDLKAVLDTRGDLAIGLNINNSHSQTKTCTNMTGNSDSPSSSMPATKKQKTGNAKPENYHSYEFRSQGEWVAVAYENDWFIGCVVNVHTAERGVVQFLSRGAQNVHRWPRVDDIDTIDCRFVFAHDFAVTSANGRTWVVAKMDYLQELYENYYSVYFKSSFDM